jgi:uncharacterized membrane protein
MVLVGVLLTAGMAVYGAVLYPTLPEQIPTHWGLNGQVDGWTPKPWGVFLVSILMGVALLSFLALPALSPRNFELEGFRTTYNYIVTVVLAMFAYIGVVGFQAALHPDQDLGRLLIGGVMGALAVLGNVLGKVRRNFWMGIRTPWTLASDKVWYATHRLGARLMMFAGGLGAVAVLAGAPPAAVFLLVLAAILWPVVHSYLLYKRLESEEGA